MVWPGRTARPTPACSALAALSSSPYSGYERAETSFATEDPATCWLAPEKETEMKAPLPAVSQETAGNPDVPFGQGLAGHVTGFLLPLFKTNRRLMRWFLPMAVLGVFLVYELVAALWVHNRIGYSYHVVAEILFLATLGPAVAFFFARLLDQWLDERDTSDWQAQLLASARANEKISRKLNDEALQAIFSAGLVIDSLKDFNPELPTELRAQAEGATVALRGLNQRLYAYLRQASDGSTIRNRR